MPSEHTPPYDPRAHPYYHHPLTHAHHPGYATYFTYPPPQPPVHWMQPLQPPPQVGNPTTEFQFRNTFAPEMPPRTPLAPCTALQSGINTPTSSTSRKRQSDENPPGRSAPKRPRHSDIENWPPSMPNIPASSSTQDPPITATGPFVAPVGTSSYEHPAFTAFTSILPKEKKNMKIASDVWFCVKRVNQKQRPHVVTNPADEELFFKRPKDCEFLACRLCT